MRASDRFRRRPAGTDRRSDFHGTGGVHVEVPPVAVTVVDTVGAGDAFMSGLLDALRDRHLLGAAARPRLGAVDGSVVRDVLSHAALVAAITVTRAGAAPPTRAELRAHG